MMCWDPHLGIIGFMRLRSEVRINSYMMAQIRKEISLSAKVVSLSFNHTLWTFGGKLP